MNNRSYFVFFLLLISSNYAYALDGDDGANIAVILFFLTISAALIIVSMMNKTFSEHPVADMVIHRALMILGFLSLYATSAVLIVMTNNTANLEIGNIIASFMETFGYVIVAGIILLFFETVLKSMKMMREIYMSKRMGEL